MTADAALLQPLLEELQTKSPRASQDQVRRAFDFAAHAHHGQVRRSGAPFVSHTVETTRILADLLGSHLDTTIATSALLHDVVEDTPITSQELGREFGTEVARLVEGVTKIGHLHFDSPRAEQAENFRKMILSMASDLRVILIKLADRVHNMRTLEFLPPEKVARIARETLEIYAPLAHRLGIGTFKRELEDLAFKHLDGEAYREIARRVQAKREERTALLDQVRAPLEQKLAEAGIQAEISGRPKHYYSIYKKLRDKNRTFDELHDLLGLRVVTTDKTSCYHVLGVVHDLFTPIQERIKDFIATPKSNMYQSLHTTVIAPGRQVVEIQIRTREMHRIAELGIAAHYSYKEGGKSDRELDQKLGGFLREAAQWTDELSDEEWMQLLQTSLYQDEIFVFTPKRELKQLPKGSTPVDFAFTIHSELGLHCVGAKVNGQFVPLRTRLRSGDTVEVISQPNGRPSKDWIEFVRTPAARHKVRHWLKAQHQAEAIVLGKEMLDRELRRVRRSAQDRALLDAAQSLGVAELAQLYAKIGQGTLSALQVVHKLFPELQERRTKGPLEQLGEMVQRKPEGVRIQGMGSLLVHIAKCCQPVPGEPVVGVVTQGHGVSVHRHVCPNTFAERVPVERRVEVTWDARLDETFPVRLVVHGQDRPSLLADIAKALAAEKCNIRTAGMSASDGSARGTFLVEVSNRRHLQEVLAAVRRVRGVSSVERFQSGLGHK
ncbi:MAG TPA: bifunctional (p)ppGpp synthetase/guanosine-3',5'-bis(diphosphate) 3'-pyrophosphohydrolase [Candidatus Saccharimonadales bacterium]|nr:bifunctional (p)ppGpp synthetase/guanosine-3',5'-bis(diphosphate) 3'-pyrophosphohydrolase [Candidatus Saccharimonadales bacterium]